MNMVVAMGRLDAFYASVRRTVGLRRRAVIVTEAGGVVCDPAGGAFGLNARRVLCGHARVAPALVECLGGVPVGPN